MALWQGKSKRKFTGGRRIYARKKRSFEIGREQQITTIGSKKLKYAQSRGGNQKIRALNVDKANVLNPKTKKTVVSDIVGVVENPADPHFVQRNIITKGATIKTKAGLAKVTSRPGQTGIINAILIKKK